MFPWCLIFLKRSLVFPILLFSSISLNCSLRRAFLSLLAILWNSAFRWVYLSFSPLPSLVFFSQLFTGPPQTAVLPFCMFFLGMVLITTFCTVLWTSSISAQIAQCHLSGKGRIDGIRSIREYAVSGLHLIEYTCVGLCITCLQEEADTDALSGSSHCFLESSSQAPPGTIESRLPIPSTQMRLWPEVIQRQSSGGREEWDGAAALQAWPW